jgi:hypothetical protein
MAKRFSIIVNSDFDAKGIEKDVMKGVDQGLTLLTLSLQKRIRKKLSKEGSGRWYFRGRNGSKAHQASAPGEPPAADSGNLMNSWQAAKKVAPKTAGKNRVLRMFPANVGSAVQYGWFLEMGTSKMLARPYLDPAMQHLRGTRATRIFESKLKNGLDTANKRVT